MPKLWGVLIICALAGNAAAESEAERLFEEGRALLAKNDPKGACDKFEGAIKLDPAATGTMLNLGLCYEKLGKYATSIAWFRKAQARATERHLTEYAEAASKYTVEIAPKVPTLAIEVLGPPETEIRVDGDKVSPTDYRELEVNPGTHQVTGTAAGKESASVTVDAKINAKLTRVTVDVSRDITHPVSHRKRNALLLGAGGVALWGVSLGTALAWNDEKRDYRLTYISNGFFAAGGVALGVAAYLYFTKPKTETLTTAIAPYVSGDQAGFAVAGAF